jgi:hypothetical protein
MKTKILSVLAALGIGSMIVLITACPSAKNTTADAGDAAKKVYVAPGKQDENYFFASGGFSGQIGVYGIPSGRLLRVIPVFSQDAEKGWGYSEETKPMLTTSQGFIPWDDTHHLQLSMTDGIPDGRWLFVNGNNTPRIARVDLRTFRTAEIIEIPNTAGNHASPFITPSRRRASPSRTPLKMATFRLLLSRIILKVHSVLSRLIKSRARWVSSFKSSCRVLAMTFRTPAKAFPTVGFSLRATTPSKRIRCLKSMPAKKIKITLLP